MIVESASRKSTRGPALKKPPTNMACNCASVGGQIGRGRRVDTVEQRADRRDTRGVARGHVHARRVEIADLLRVRTGRGVRRRRLFDDPAHDVLVVLRQLHEARPIGAVRRDRVVLFPAAGGELREVVAGLARRIDAREVEPVRGRCLRQGRVRRNGTVETVQPGCAGVMDGRDAERDGGGESECPQSLAELAHEDLRRTKERSRNVRILT